MSKWSMVNEPLQGGFVDDSGNPINTGDGPTIQPGTPDHLKHGGKYNLREKHKEAGGHKLQGTSTSQSLPTTQAISNEGNNDSLTQCEKEFDDLFQAIRNGIANVANPIDVNTSVSLPSITFESTDNDTFLKDMDESKEIKVIATRPIAGETKNFRALLIKGVLHFIIKSEAAKSFTTRAAKSTAKPFCGFIDFKMWFEGLSPEEQWYWMGQL